MRKQPRIRRRGFLDRDVAARQSPLHTNFLQLLKPFEPEFCNTIFVGGRRLRILPAIAFHQAEEFRGRKIGENRGLKGKAKQCRSPGNYRGGKVEVVGVDNY